MDALPFSMKENRLELRVSANPYDQLIATYSEDVAQKTFPDTFRRWRILEIGRGARRECIIQRPDRISSNETGGSRRINDEEIRFEYIAGDFRSRREIRSEHSKRLRFQRISSYTCHSTLNTSSYYFARQLHWIEGILQDYNVPAIDHWWQTELGYPGAGK